MFHSIVRAAGDLFQLYQDLAGGPCRGPSIITRQTLARLKQVWRICWREPHRPVRAGTLLWAGRDLLGRLVQGLIGRPMIRGQGGQGRRRLAEALAIDPEVRHDPFDE